MAAVTRTTTWSTGDTLTAAALNAEFNNLLNAPAIVNADITAGAAISASKIANTAATLSDTQTLTNKTITSPSIGGTVAGSATYTKPTINGSVQAYTSDTDGATVTFSMAASNIHTVTLGGNRTLAVSNVSTGQSFFIILRQDGTGSRTVTFWGSILWPGGSAPVLSTVANEYDVFSFVYDGTNYFGFIVGQGLS